MIANPPAILGFAFTAVKALLEVFLIGFSGYVFARNGTLNKSTLKSLSVMSVDLLTPALLFSKMIETLDPALLAKLWNEPVFYFIYGGFSLLWSRMGSRLFRLDDDYARLCDVATFFANTNTLPVSLIKSIALSSGSHFLLKDETDTPLKVAARGVSYAMIFATLNNILRWSFGVALMGGMSPKNKSAFNSVNATPRIALPARDARGISGLPSSPPLVAGGSLSLGGSEDNMSDDDSSDELSPLYLGAPAEPLRRHHPAVRFVRTAALKACKLWESIQSCITAPVYAIVAAFAVILIEPLHQAFMDQDTVLYTIWSAIDMCGDACVPLILISLGGQLGLMAREKKDAKRALQSAHSIHALHSRRLGALVEHEGLSTCASSSSELTNVGPTAHSNGIDSPIPSITVRTPTEAGASQHNLDGLESLGAEACADISPQEQRRGIILVLVGRFVFVPTLAIILITALRVLFPRLLPIMADDPVYILTLLVLASTPPAINLITVSQATGKFETEAAQILFYGYVLGIFVMAVEVSGFLWLTSALSSM
ncbi:hypothetical protein GQ54DRAFT_307600 [Martensiomyces pterosporus]|nr:hypothetical protein GQ54DRAFT_307600 [Martensiomyces pterosporus]